MCNTHVIETQAVVEFFCIDIMLISSKEETNREIMSLFEAIICFKWPTTGMRKIKMYEDRIYIDCVLGLDFSPINCGDQKPLLWRRHGFPCSFTAKCGFAARNKLKSQHQ